MNLSTYFHWTLSSSISPRGNNSPSCICRWITSFTFVNLIPVTTLKVRRTSFVDFLNFLNFRIYFMIFLLQHLPVFLDVWSRFFQTEITMGAGISIVAIAHTITTTRVLLRPRAVDFYRLFVTGFLATKYTTVFILDVLVTTKAFIFLEDRRID